MPVISDQTINALFAQNRVASGMSDIYVDVTDISKNITAFELVHCNIDDKKLLRVSGFCVAASNSKDLETALDVLYGKSLTPQNIAAQAKFNASRNKYNTVLNPAFSVKANRVLEYKTPVTCEEPKLNLGISDPTMYTPPVSTLTMMSGKGDCKSLHSIAHREFSEAVKSREAESKRVTAKPLFTSPSTPLANITSVKDSLNRSISPLTAGRSIDIPTETPPSYSSTLLGESAFDTSKSPLSFNVQQQQIGFRCLNINCLQ